MPYTAPTPTELKTRFPAFTAVDDATVQYWLTDALLIVTDSWIEADRAPAEMALAAHNLASEGYGSGTIGANLPAGVTRFRSGAMDVSLSEAAVSSAAAGGYSSTRYGKAFLTYLRRNRGGPSLVSVTVPTGCP